MITPGPLGEFAFEPLVVGDEGINDLRVSLRPRSTVTGRVTFEGGEFPRSGLTVATRGDPRLPGGSSVQTNERWEFELAGLPSPQLIRVTPLPPGWWLKSVMTGGRDITDYAVDLGAGLSDVEIVVSHAMSTLKGTVRASDGELPPDSAIVIFSDEPNEWRASATTLRRVWPSADGRFQIAGLRPGRYNVIAVDRTPSRVEENPAAFLASVRAQSSPVSIGERETLEVALTLRRYRE